MIKTFKAKTRRNGSHQLETVTVTAKSMIKALEYLADLKYDEPDSISVLETQPGDHPSSLKTE